MVDPNPVKRNLDSRAMNATATNHWVNFKVQNPAKVRNVHPNNPRMLIGKASKLA